MKTFDRFSVINKNEFKRYKKKTFIHAKQMDEEFKVETEEGTMIGHKGDYLAIGVKGELYPIKEAIFKETYEEVREFTIPPHIIED